jgi:hypothetical protein
MINWLWWLWWFASQRADITQCRILPKGDILHVEAARFLVRHVMTQATASPAQPGNAGFGHATAPMCKKLDDEELDSPESVRLGVQLRKLSNVGQSLHRWPKIYYLELLRASEGTLSRRSRQRGGLWPVLLMSNPKRRPVPQQWVH